MSTVETPAFEVLGPVRNRVGESPLWSVAEQALWWVDIEGRTLYRHDAVSGTIAQWPTVQRIGCIALHASGGLLAAMETGLFHLQPKAGAELSARTVALAHHARPDMRFNDGRCDRHGRFWVSSMVLDMSLAVPAGALYRFDAQGLSAPIVSELVVGNGLAFSPRGDTLYLSDSHPTVQRIWQFDLHDDGSLSNRREFVDMKPHPGRPDGAAVDADGCYWICGNDAGRLLRFTPDGQLDRTLALPFSKPAMCAFGGASLDTLFVTSIIPAKPADGFDATLDGAVLALRPGVQGLPELPCIAPLVPT
ncbi:MAG TPA: SMP-30/gluconolactonase/LRE family protein [Rhizobacter sp.]|nr:SMP-30/gluconolactonase/LRE family protein [Rhizobacter sp.]